MALTTNIVSYWKLNESSGDAIDSLGSNTLTNNNAVTYVAGLINNCAAFGTANTNKSLTIGSNLGLTLSSAASVSMWVKLQTEISSSAYGLFDLSDATSDLYLRTYYSYNGGTRRVTFARGRNGFGEVVVNNNIALGTSSWHHIVLTWAGNGGNLTGYVDGVSAGTTSTSSNGNNGFVSQFSVGCMFNEGTGALDTYGSEMLDEIGVWSRELTGTEVTQLYNGGAGLTYPFIPTAGGAFLLNFI